MACAVFARGVFVELLAEILPAVDLARFSSTSTRFYSQAASLAFASIRAEHGLMIPGATLLIRCRKRRTNWSTSRRMERAVSSSCRRRRRVSTGRWNAQPTLIVR